jgi:hypothetical protein
MRDHLIAKDFKDCMLMVEYADLLYLLPAAPSPPGTERSRRRHDFFTR